MNDTLFQALLLYRTTMAAVKNMFEKRLISADEYAEIDNKIATKYGLEFSVIYR